MLIHKFQFCIAILLAYHFGTITHNQFTKESYNLIARDLYNLITQSLMERSFSKITRKLSFKLQDGILNNKKRELAEFDLKNKAREFHECTYIPSELSNECVMLALLLYFMNSLQKC